MNPYPPLKYYIRSLTKLRSKQKSDLEFDEAIGFHLPTNKCPRKQSGKPISKPVTFTGIPFSLSNRLSKTTINTDMEAHNNPVIYPFVVNDAFS